ncbi:MAG: disulfide bond formation protein B, partial [Pseudomonadota bacterium]
MTLPKPALLNYAGALISAGLMAYALYAQHVLLLEPCPLCVLQRIAVIVLGILFLIAAIQNPTGKVGRGVYTVLVGLAAAAGATVAGWHVHLQNLPLDEVPSCGPGFDYLVGNFPLKDALAKIFSGSGECATIDWQFLGLSMPTW